MASVLRRSDPEPREERFLGRLAPKEISDALAAGHGPGWFEDGRPVPPACPAGQQALSPEDAEHVIAEDLRPQVAVVGRVVADQMEERCRHTRAVEERKTSQPKSGAISVPDADGLCPV